LREISNSHSRPLRQNTLLRPLKLPSMTDMAPSRKSVNQITADPIVSRKATKMIEAAEPTNCQPTLSDIRRPYLRRGGLPSYHRVTTQGQTAEFVPLSNEDQLLQMLFSMRNQLENQRTEMIRLREVATCEKEVATRVQTCFLKQI